jgi:DNA-damage-inducible protein D
MEQHNKIVLFQERQIRKIWHKEDWWFSIIDAIQVLTDSPQPSRYWNELREKLIQESANNELFANTEKLKMPSLDGKMRGTDAANTKTMLRLIMSIPSPKAEPFKQWLAQVGQERIEEIENPELGIERIKEIYRAKGYPNEWIDMRIQSIEVRKQLTDEWKKRDVKEGQEYSILTAQIAKATFGLSPTEHKNLKGLDRQNLRDHMTTLELIFTQLGEEMTRKLAVDTDAQGFHENSDVAKQGGRAAGDALKAAEKRTGVKVVTADNFMNQIVAAKKSLKPPKKKNGAKDDKIEE